MAAPLGPATAMELTRSASVSDFDLLRAACTADENTIDTMKKIFPELTTATIIRHLVVCDNDVKKTTAHLEACKAWRQQTFPMTSMPLSQTPTGEGLIYAHGEDVLGHPMFIFNSRLSNPKTRNLDVLMRWFIFMMEVAISRLPPNMTQITVLVNRTGSKHEIDIEFGKRVQFVLDNYYPERLFAAIYYPVSVALKASWSVMKLVASRSYARFRLAHSLEQLRKRIPDEYIPLELGGSCRYKFNMQDYSSAAPKQQTASISNVCAGDQGSAANRRGMPVAMDDAAAGMTEEVLLDDLYEPEGVDDFATKSISQASVAGLFVQKRPGATARAAPLSAFAPYGDLPLKPMQETVRELDKDAQEMFSCLDDYPELSESDNSGDVKYKPVAATGAAAESSGSARQGTDNGIGNVNGNNNDSDNGNGGDEKAVLHTLTGTFGTANVGSDRAVGDEAPRHLRVKPAPADSRTGAAAAATATTGAVGEFGCLWCSM
jgi:hypothetical protein